MICKNLGKNLTESGKKLVKPNLNTQKAIKPSGPPGNVNQPSGE